MDPTYFVAFALSVVIGFVSALIFIAMKGRSYGRFTLATLLAAVFADFALLVDWRHANEMTALFLLTDAAIFAVYGLIGGAIGALPVICARSAYRAFRDRRTK